MTTIRRIANAINAARPTVRATAVLTAYRVAIDLGDYGAASRRKIEFVRFGTGARRNALATVYGDVLPSHRVGYAFAGSGALVARAYAVETAFA